MPDVTMLLYYSTKNCQFASFSVEGKVSKWEACRAERGTHRNVVQPVNGRYWMDTRDAEAYAAAIVEAVRWVEEWRKERGG